MTTQLIFNCFSLYWNKTLADGQIEKVHTTITQPAIKETCTPEKTDTISSNKSIVAVTKETSSKSCVITFYRTQVLSVIQHTS